MADTYLMESLEADPEALRDNAVNRLRELLDGYDPERDPYGSLLLQAVVEAQVPLVEVVSDVLATIFAHVAEVAGTERIMPSPAAGLIAVTTDGAETRVLPAGATLRGTLPDGTSVVFATTADETIDQSYAPNIAVEAVHDGQLATLTLPQTLEPDQAYTWLQDVTLTHLPTLGTDGEDDEAYMDRAASAMRDQADMLILPDDVQRFVQRIPGVGRSLVLDQVDATDPEAPTRPVARSVTVVVTGPGGAELEDDSPLLEDVRTRLEARREVGFRFFVAPATYVPLEIELTVAAWPEAAGDDTSAATASRVEETLRTWLDPGTFGSRGRVSDGGWQPTTTLRIGEVVSAADGVAEVDYVDPTLVLINGQNVDFEMAAPLAALPKKGEDLAITVNVVERQP
jgi:hypothetical protein